MFFITSGVESQSSGTYRGGEGEKRFKRSRIEAAGLREKRGKQQVGTGSSEEHSGHANSEK